MGNIHPYLVISDVLPTDCSPRNTNLNFRSGLPKSFAVILFVENRQSKKD